MSVFQGVSSFKRKFAVTAPSTVTISKNGNDWNIVQKIFLLWGLSVTTVLNCTEGVEFRSGLSSIFYLIKINFYKKIYIYIVSSDERNVLTKVYSDDPKKFIQEDRDPKTNKLISIITHEVLDNGYLLAVLI